MEKIAYSEQTRDRLLQASVEIFAERGFKAATVREICAAAGVNIASVNYYFRSKEVLYAEALSFAFAQGDARYPALPPENAELSAEEQLSLIITNLLRRVTDESHLGFQGKLIAREIASPTSALDPIVETIMRPRFKVLRDILPQLLGSGCSDAAISRCILSIIGQCLVYRHSRSLVVRLCPEIIADPEEIERTAKHIVQFSLAALRGLAQQGE